MPKRLLFISNGHGEDNHSSHVVRALKEADASLDIAALPLVGEGAAYRRLGVPIIAPTLTLPSGGFTYMDRRLLIDDIRAGLLTSTLRQWRAVRAYARGCDLVFATGDSVGQTFAFGSRRPFVSFISCLSALYTGKVRLDLLLQLWFRSPRCRVIFTRDPYTAENLRARGFAKARFGGIPSLDYLTPTGKDMKRRDGAALVALLPGSRLPEAQRNFRMMLRLARFAAEIAARDASLPAVDFRAALVPGVMSDLAAVAAAEGWDFQPPDRLVWSDGEARADVICSSDAFADIIQAATLTIGMAGLAVDQGVALGKPTLLIPGEGPQHTYAFAESQERLLGLSAKAYGKGPATDSDLREAAAAMFRIAGDKDYLTKARENGFARFGGPGASKRIAGAVLELLEGRAP